MCHTGGTRGPVRRPVRGSSGWGPNVVEKLIRLLVQSRSNLGSRLRTVAHGCTRLHSFAAPSAVSLPDCTVKGWGGQRTTCVKSHDLPSLAPWPYWQRSYEGQ